MTQLSLFSLSASALIAFLLNARQASAQAIVMAPPSIIQCQPAAITWSGATGTVYLSVIEGNNPSSTPLESFPTQSGSSGMYTINPVTIKAGTVITFIINDDTGAPNYSSQVTVAAGGTSCDATLGSGSSGSGATSGSTSSASPASTSSRSATSSSASNSPTSSPNQSSSAAAGLRSSVAGLLVVGAGALASHLL
ncbi:hypothetical protein IE53DRAFT_391173 [Violaceomyces palustris]|uniref:Uncharacterized protein n=1 Tax=Violaceomyces palustris TaxID=1673888 RepID=A0ACD0NLH1_9BASI|nr:hypothetical protein IE53DRAFT_391173 [Violaceomyces palustris]